MREQTPSETPVRGRKLVEKSASLLGLAELQGAVAESLQSDNVLAEDSGARRLASASALRSHPLSINFRRRNGTLEAAGRDLGI